VVAMLGEIKSGEILEPANAREPARLIRLSRAMRVMGGKYLHRLERQVTLQTKWF
jgi:hypothetical protein